MNVAPIQYSSKITQLKQSNQKQSNWLLFKKKKQKTMQKEKQSN